jgi:hypothetical protein
MELTRRANSRTDGAEDARPARLILLLAEGHTWDEVSERIECCRGFVATWNKRFVEQRIAGLCSRHLGQVAISSTQNTAACAGEFRYKPMMSAALVSKSRSFDAM